MSRPHPAEVASVAPRSPAVRARIQPGERIISVNGRSPRDYIEYRYLAAEPRVRLLIESTGNERRRVVIEKRIDEDLGLRFTSDVFDGIITCRNRCAFCFVKQLPPGLRPALYVRDDDYRLSFLHGNFITLTNLTPSDRARIARYHLSPLYVSVHATEPEVRRRIFGGPTPDPVIEMHRLGAKGIRFHVQVVVCPGINDGTHLERTVRDLAAMHPVLQSIGIVPVGMTRHRKQVVRLRAVTPAKSHEIIDAVSRWQREFKDELGTRLIFAADELYLLAGLPLPGRARYEDFPQLGNGIGCARRFLDGIARVKPPSVASPLHVVLITGEMARPLVEEFAAKMRSSMLGVEVVSVRNRLFGTSVTVAGLLAGADIARALRQIWKADLMIVPGTAIREGEGFIDGMTPKQLSDITGGPVVAASTPAEAAGAVRRFERARRRR